MSFPPDLGRTEFHGKVTVRTLPPDPQGEGDKNQIKRVLRYSCGYQCGQGLRLPEASNSLTK